MTDVPMSELSAEKVVAELRARANKEPLLLTDPPQTTALAKLLDRAADLIVDQAARLEEWIARSEPWQRRAVAAEAALTAAEAEKERLNGLIEEARPHVAKIAGCIRINDEWGRVVTGQTEAAAVLRDIFARAVLFPKKEQTDV